MEFAQSETEYRRIRAQLDSGQLTETEFKARLQELMVEDERGRWWVIGYETGQWYVHDGENWLPAEPPRSVPPQSAEPPMAVTDQTAATATLAAVAEPVGGAASAATATAPSTRRVAMTGRALALIIVAWMTCSGFWQYLYNDVGIYGATRIVAAGAWFLVGLATGVAVRLVEPAVRWSSILIGAFVWGVASLLIFPDNIFDAVPFVIRLAFIGLVGGLAIGLMVKRALAPMHLYHVLIIAAAWVIAFLVGFKLEEFVVNEFFGDFNVGIVAIGGAIVGAIGGGVTLWLVRRAQRFSARQQ